MAVNETKSLKVAVLGVGTMGAPLATHLARSGYSVRAWDINKANMAPLRSEGIEACESAKRATESVDVILTMMTDADAVLDVMVGSHAALGDFKGLWIQSTTVGVEGTRKLYEAALKAGTTYVDVPLLGTRSVAEAGNLTALGSGSEEAKKQSEPVLSTFCTKILWLGEVGQSSKFKLVLNSWILGLATLTAETIALCTSFGFPAENFLDFISGGPFDVGQAHIKGGAIIAEDFSPLLALRLAAKDAGLVVAASEELGISLQVARAVFEQMRTAQALGHGDEDYVAVWFATSANPGAK